MSDGSGGRGAERAVERMRPRRSRLGHRAQAAGAMVLLLPSVVGCYQYVPVTASAPAAGTEISVGVNDQGRVALASQIGPGARRLLGRLTQATDSAFVISLTAVEYVGASAAARWAGEPVRISRQFVSDIGERRLSRTRSWLTAGLFAALAVAVSAIAIEGFGSDGGSDRPPGGGPVDQ